MRPYFMVDVVYSIVNVYESGITAVDLKKTLVEQQGVIPSQAERLMQHCLDQGIIVLGQSLKLFPGKNPGLIVMKSEVDKSINFVEQQLVGFIESRYVRRTDEYFIAYLSSQTGCNHMCRMCHLTQTKQRQFTQCKPDDFKGQLNNIIAHYKQDKPANYMHINFMARGEPLANPDVNCNLMNFLYQTLREEQIDIPIKYNVSTIMPKSVGSLVDRFRTITPTIYYSMYSMRQDFRDKWLPAAENTSTALEILKDYQKFTKKLIKFHCAFIKGENDGYSDVRDMMHMITKFHGIQGEFNIVRYNPYSSEQGEETSEEQLHNIKEIIGEYMPVQIIPRVGQDVKASCGTFV